VVQAIFRQKHNADNKVNWDFWMTSSSDRALDFLSDIKDF